MPAPRIHDADPVCTVAIPSLNQGRFIGATLASVFAQDLPVEVIVLDAGSTDGTLDEIRKWEPRLLQWRSRADDGQAAAINEGIVAGRAPYVMWLNSDDVLLPGGLRTLIDALERAPDAPAAYGRARIIDEAGAAIGDYRTHAFSAARLSRRCFISQPASVVRRAAWTQVGGVDASLSMAFDYDLWWRLLRHAGTPLFVDRHVAATRSHSLTKTASKPVQHYREAYAVLRRHHGSVPLWWFVKAPVSIGVRAARGLFAR